MSNAMMGTRVSKFYLDWAERLPRCRWGWLRELQEIREDQHQDAARSEESTRPSENTTCAYLGLKLIEVFHAEQFQDLYSGLLRLFPDLHRPGQFPVEDFQTWFERSAALGSLYSWPVVGVVRRALTPSYRIQPRPRVALPELPEEVEYATVGLYKVLPSTIVVHVDVAMRPLATGRLAAIREMHHLPEITLRQLIPFFPYRGHRETPSHAAVLRATSSWLFTLRERIESIFLRYFGGYFAHHPARSGEKFPAIEIYSIPNGCGTRPTFDQWRNDARDWLHCLGFNPPSSVLFLGESETFEWNAVDFSSTGEEAAHRLAIFEPPDEISLDQGVRQDELSALGNGLALLEYFDRLTVKVGNWRDRLSDSHSRSFLNRAFTLTDELLAEQLPLTRLLSEYRTERGRLDGELSHLQNLTHAYLPPGKSTLARVLSYQIERRSRLLQTQIRLSQEWLQNLIGVRNTRAMYWLQWVVLLLAIVSATTPLAQLWRGCSAMP